MKKYKGFNPADHYGDKVSVLMDAWGDELLADYRRFHAEAVAKIIPPEYRHLVEFYEHPFQRFMDPQTAIGVIGWEYRKPMQKLLTE